MNLILKAILVPFGYVSYYVTRYNDRYYIMYDDRKSGLVRIGSSDTLRMTLYVIKYHIRTYKKVAFTTDEIWDAFTQWKLYDFSKVNFNDPVDVKKVFSKKEGGA